MTQPPSPGQIDHPLAQKALARLRAICKGNGVHTKKIILQDAAVEEVIFTAGTFFELEPTSQEKVLPGRQQVGETIANPQDLERMAAELRDQAQRNKALEEALQKQLTARKDKGFMLQDLSLPVSGFTRELSWHEPCTTCNHSGHVTCDQCHGRKYQPCQHCHGQTMMQCPLCRGTGHIAGQRGQQPCNKCNGMRRIPCTYCRATGKIPCRKCQARGQITCPSCRGQAFSTRVITLGLKATTRADYARGDVPEHMTFLIENDGPKLVARGDVSVTTRALPDDQALGLHYDGHFCFARLAIKLDQKPLKLEAYGTGQFVRLPPILDDLLAGPLHWLQRAAKGQGDVAGLLKQAGRYRAVAFTLVTTIRANAMKTAQRLLKKYPEGLSPDMAARIGKAADAAVAQITRKPRYTGLLIGLVLVTGLYALYYLGPGRDLLMPHIPGNRFNVIIDLFLIFMGGTITTLSIQFSARGALHKALGHLIPPARRKTFMPRTHGAGLWGYGAGALIYFALIEFTRHTQSAATPIWYQHALSLIGLS